MSPLFSFCFSFFSVALPGGAPPGPPCRLPPRSSPPLGAAKSRFYLSATRISDESSMREERRNKEERGDRNRSPTRPHAQELEDKRVRGSPSLRLYKQHLRIRVRGPQSGHCAPSEAPLRRHFSPLQIAIGAIQPYEHLEAATSQHHLRSTKVNNIAVTWKLIIYTANANRSECRK